MKTCGDCVTKEALRTEMNILKTAMRTEVDILKREIRSAFAGVASGEYEHVGWDCVQHGISSLTPLNPCDHSRGGCLKLYRVKP